MNAIHWGRFTLRPVPMLWGAILWGSMLLAFATAAAAHGIEYSVETTADERIRIGGFFSSGQPIGGATVTVRDDAGREIHRGRTDPKGLVRFRATPGTFTFVLDDGAGHRIEERFELRPHQLDGRVRDLIAEMGRKPTVLERIRALPRWLTAGLGLAVILVIFATLRRVRARAAHRESPASKSA